MYCYSAYGLNVMSSLPLLELLTGEGKADIYVEVAEMKSTAAHEHSEIRCVSATPNRVHLTWGKVGGLLIEDGQRITVIPTPETDEEELRLFILGAGLGVLLHQRGLLVFHASGIAINDQAVGFIGAKGWGKSTTAAILHQRGHALISDELLVVRFDEQGQPWAIPGSPQIKLWVDALVGIGENPDSAIRVRSGVDKYNIKVASIAPDELPFHSLYLLDAGENLSIQSTSPSEAFLGVIPHLYAYRFGDFFLQRIGMVHSFQQLNQLLKKITVKRLVRQRDLTQLPGIAQQIEQNFFQSLQNFPDRQA